MAENAALSRPRTWPNQDLLTEMLHRGLNEHLLASLKTHILILRPRTCECDLIWESKLN